MNAVNKGSDTNEAQDCSLTVVHVQQESERWASVHVKLVSDHRRYGRAMTDHDAYGVLEDFQIRSHYTLH